MHYCAELTCAELCTTTILCSTCTTKLLFTKEVRELEDWQVPLHFQGPGKTGKYNVEQNTAILSKTEEVVETTWEEDFDDFNFAPAVDLFAEEGVE